ncbi:hypothetical protein NDU88_005459 [Pleurodeles waltl]|uniref:Integrase p58-like C-terminal domain-containing protein n=1 Tax=Pleurodeles waltl TaxID=8319 RepID=A0AAV7L0U8_PLEWA|nr:hypothetical protein NDU88_005459 [Pleurodeles waltl]
MQSSTGHSPFELLFGRQLRTLFEILAEQWEESEDDLKDILTYMRELKENLHKIWEEAHKTLRDAQEKQKAHYDAHSSPRSLTVGQKVLVLLPSTENKLLACWLGPYTVLEQATPTTYKSEIPNGSGREQIYHINLLKTWYENTESTMDMYKTTGSEGSIPVYPTEVSTETEIIMPQINDTLLVEQKTQLRDLVQGSLDVFSKKPGRTHMIQHHIRTIGDRVARQ